MNNKLVFGLGLIIGGAAGVAVSWQYFKTKYQEISDEEIASVKKTFARREPVEIDPDMQNKAEQARENPDIATYANILKENGYRDYSNAESQKKPEKHPVEIEEDKPYVISPDSFGEMDDYNRISLTYYADGVLADEDDEVVDDMDATVGSDALDHFGEYEDDSVFVRNDSRKCDYEILLDTRNYADVAKQKPRVMED